MNFLKQLLTEDRLDYIAHQMGAKLLKAFQNDGGKKPPMSSKVTPVFILNYLAQAGKDYIQWVARQYASGQFRWEDLPQIKTNIVKFVQLSKAGVISNKDLNSYPTVAALRIAIADQNVAGESYKGKFEKLYQGIDQAVGQGLGKWLYNKPTDPIKIYIPTSEAGSVCIRKSYPDISWCTTHEDDIDSIKEKVIERIATERWNKRDRSRIRQWEEDDAWYALEKQVIDEVEDGEHDDDITEFRENMHNYYLREYGGEYYVIITPDGPFQFHFESGQFKDEDDADIDFRSFVSKYPSVRKVLEPIINKKGHPHFRTNLTKDQVKTAIATSWNNLKFVSTNDFADQDFIDIGLAKFRSERVDSHSGRIMGSYGLINTLTNLLKTADKSNRQCAHIWNEIIKSLPVNSFPAQYMPHWIKPLINPEIGKRMDGYDAWVNS
jgi:hypothetical protein